MSHVKDYQVEGGGGEGEEGGGVRRMVRGKGREGGKGRGKREEDAPANTETYGALPITTDQLINT